MSDNGIPGRKRKNEHSDGDSDVDEIGDNHYGSGIETPLRSDAFELSDEEKVEQIAEKFRDIMKIMGMDLRDDSLEGTPDRVAKMFVKELFYGLKPENKPEPRVFDNSYRYGEMLVEKNISVFSACEHHFLPMVGKAHVAYISNGHVIGLSKINRIVDYFARRPQVQERLTLQVANELKQALDTEDVAVFIECKHYCVIMRGVEDHGSTTVTSSFSGAFEKENMKNQFMEAINHKLVQDD